MDFETALDIPNINSTYGLTPAGVATGLMHKSKTAAPIDDAAVALKNTAWFLKRLQGRPAAIRQVTENVWELHYAKKGPATMFSKANTAMTGVGAAISSITLGNTIYNYKQGEATGWDILHDVGSTGNAFLGFVPGVGTAASAIITGIDLVSTPLLTAAYTQHYIEKSYGAPGTGGPGITHGQTNYCHY